MKLHGYDFPVCKIEDFGKATAYNAIEYVKGWANEDNTIGFYQPIGKRSWWAIDCCSGTLICVCSTRKECVAWVEENMERIQRRKKEEDYLQKVKEFKELLQNEKTEDCS